MRSVSTALCALLLYALSCDAFHVKGWHKFRLPANFATISREVVKDDVNGVEIPESNSVQLKHPPVSVDHMFE